MPRGAWKHITFAWLISLAVALFTPDARPAVENIPGLILSKSSIPLSISGVFLTLILLASSARLSLRVCRTYSLTPLLAIYSMAIFAPYAWLSLHQPKAAFSAILLLFSLIKLLSPGVSKALLSSAYLLAGTFLYLPLGFLAPLFMIFLAMEKNIRRLGAFLGMFTCGFLILIAAGLIRPFAIGSGGYTLKWSGFFMELKNLAGLARMQAPLYLLICYAPFLLAGVASSTSGALRQVRAPVIVLTSVMFLIIIMPLSMHSGVDTAPLILALWSLFFPAVVVGAFAMIAMLKTESSMAWDLIVATTFLIPAALSLVYHQAL